ncbi:MAG TPA: winged helix-turn-helix domain-containing protein [Bryobacteraceae bacterium]|nr:winged helix-turn-helix domain-containing protein [Bryobacteraceae bacterium]
MERAGHHHSGRSTPSCLGYDERVAGREVYEFAEFALDVGERRLLHHGQPVGLAPKTFDLLVTFVRNAGRLLRKDELLHAVWPDSFVEEGILPVHVSQLRRLLGRSFIETVAGSGYRFASLGVPQRTAPVNPELEEYYRRGRAHLLAASRAESPKAVEAFQAALAIDATYAPAHAGLALAWCAQAEFRVVPHRDAYQHAKTAALAALALDFACADAQVALGIVLFLSEWNWVAAERSLRRAIDLNPDHTEAYLIFGRLLEAQGRLHEGLCMKQKALEREPSSALVHLQIALSYWNQRCYDQSIEWAARALELDPHHLLAREHLAAAYWKKGDPDRHMAESLRHARDAGAPTGLVEEIERVYTAGGRAAVISWSLVHLAAAGYRVPAVQLAILHGESGDMDAAFHHLDRALDARDPCLVHLAVAPQWDSLRADPRFERCLVRMGLSSS